MTTELGGLRVQDLEEGSLLDVVRDLRLQVVLVVAERANVEGHLAGDTEPLLRAGSWMI